MTYYRYGNNQYALSGVEANAFGEANTYGNGRVNYVAATDSYAFDRNLMFGPADRDPGAPAGTIGYRRTIGANLLTFEIVTPTVNSRPFEYARSAHYGEYGGTNKDFYCVLGVPTLVTDHPTETIVNFSPLTIIGKAFTISPTNTNFQTYTLSASRGTMTVNLVTGKVDVTIRLIGQQTINGVVQETSLGTHTTSADIDAVAGTYNGLFRHDVDPVSMGSYLGGWFFGPQGKEAMFTANMNLRNPSDGGRIFASFNAGASR